MQKSTLIKTIEQSLAIKITLTIVAVFLLTISISSILSFQEEKSRTLNLLKDQMQERSLSIFDSLNMLMLTGSMEERETLRKKILGSKDILDVRFLRSDFVNTQYDEGLASEKLQDEWDHSVLRGHKVVETGIINDQRALTVIMPLTATENTRSVDCLSCHEVTSGTVIGGVRLSVSLESEYAAIEFGLLKNLAINTVLFLTGILLLRYMLKRILIQPLSTALQAAQRIASGDMSQTIEIHSHDEIGKVLASLNSMQSELFVQIEADKDAALRIKEALDASSTPVQIADKDYNIFYCNHAGHEMFRKYNHILKKHIPNFDPERIIGANMDIFHKNPAHQRKVLEHLQQSFQSDDVDFGEIIVRVTATPITNTRNERIGTVLEWLNRTDEVLVEREVEAFISAAAAGDLSQRILTEEKSGFFLNLAQGMNQQAQVNEQIIADTNQVLEALSRGDLTQNISNEYQGSFANLKNHANESMDKLTALISDVSSIANEVALASQEINQGNNTLSERTQGQASALEQTAASIEEISSTVKHNAENTQQADQLASDATQQASQGAEVSGRAIQAMQGISSSSKKISDIIGVIDEIAFQTNLLALNAAVEAARAGEQGRGFAVVASEVRTLAGRSAQAAKEIKGLINTSVESVEAGSKLVNESGEALTHIVQSVQKVSGIIAEISSSSQEQALGIEQINRAISQMDTGVQQNAALVEETAAASQTLNEQAGDMQSAVATFKL
ncbi:MAG: methyl-accepting chemotaxis protein [Mariprofundaceae bacterium]